MLVTLSCSFVIAHVLGIFICILFGYTKLANPYTGVIYVLIGLLLGAPFSGDPSSRLSFAVFNSIIWLFAWRFALITPIVAARKPK